ncbi:sigma factor [Pararhizobium haloflavum]|uniref:sigma factor n=1 Tax=Pararhizobium haloflavum TaxID=2037914 RepID=UPI000C189210|nr:sigma factor [Pararhizobium haloflavum]
MVALDETRLADLLRRANRGDAAAYADFYRTLLPALRQIAHGVVRTVGGRPSDVEDVVQETMIAIHLKRHTWRESEMVGPWIRAISRYKSVDVMRRRGRHGASVDIDVVTETLAAPTIEDPTARTDLERYVSRLGGKPGAIVKAIGLDGQEIVEVARRMSMSEGAVRVALHRGLRKLAALRTQEAD